MVETHSEKTTHRLCPRIHLRAALDSQLEQLRDAGCSSRNIYRELTRKLGKLSSGDVVTVTRVDRLARNKFDLFGILRRIVDAKAQFRSLAGP